MAESGELEGDEEDVRCSAWVKARPTKDGDPNHKKQVMANQNIVRLHFIQFSQLLLMR